MTVTPLAPVDAEKLAADLLTGERIATPDLSVSAAAIAEEVDYFPFYIHHVVGGLRHEQLERTTTSKTLSLVSWLTPVVRGSWLHCDRLTTYYPDSDDATT